MTDKLETLRQYQSWRKGVDVRITAEDIDDAFDWAIAELERLRGITPELPPRPPEGEGLPRYGIRWNGPTEPLAVPMDDGYWTPWHLAVQSRPAVPDGWRVVPEKLTDGMECVDLDIAGNSHWHGTAEIDPQRLERLWRDLLNAAPQPPNKCTHVGVIDHAMMSGVSLTGDGAALPHGTKLYAALQPQ